MSVLQRSVFWGFFVAGLLVLDGRDCDLSSCADSFHANVTCDTVIGIVEI